MNLKKIEEATRLLLDAIGDTEIAESTARTPLRVAKSYEELLDGYNAPVDSFFDATDNGHGTDQLVVIKDIETTSLCAHHLLPFALKIAIGYLPRDKVIGISKLGRLAVAYSHRLQLQERLTKSLATVLMEKLNPLGVAVVTEGAHQCMRCRGVRLPSSNVVVSEMLGKFRTDTDLRREFLSLIGK